MVFASFGRKPPPVCGCFASSAPTSAGRSALPATPLRQSKSYSFGNILEIARQKPQASRVAGIYAWNLLGRRLMKDEEANKDIRIQNQAVLVGFRSAYVFDVSQTDGKGLPELSERVRGNVGEYRKRLVDFVIAQGITLEFKKSIAPALGMCYGDRIVVLPGQSPAEEFSTLVHELAHAFLHRAERRITTTKTVRKTEADAIAFVVGTTIGLHNGRASSGAPYRLQNWWTNGSCALPNSTAPELPRRRRSCGQTNRLEGSCRRLGAARDPPLH